MATATTIPAPTVQLDETFVSSSGAGTRVIISDHPVGLTTVHVAVRGHHGTYFLTPDEGRAILEDFESAATVEEVARVMIALSATDFGPVDITRCAH